MKNKEIESKLRDYILELSKRKVDPAEITNGTDLIKDLGFDSIAIVQMIAELEDNFKILFEDIELDMSILTDYSKLKELIINKINFSSY